MIRTQNKSVKIITMLIFFIFIVSCKNDTGLVTELTLVSNDTIISWVKRHTFPMSKGLNFKDTLGNKINHDSILKIESSRDFRFDYFVNQSNKVVEVVVNIATDEDKVFFDYMTNLNTSSYMEGTNTNIDIDKLLIMNESKTKAISQQILTDNIELIEIYKNDQTDRNSDNIDWSVVSKRDSIREMRVYELIDSNRLQTSKDYFNAAMIFQHGENSIAYAMAVNLMKKAIELDSTANKWLFAAAIDRYLLSKNESQIFGTQYQKLGQDQPWQLGKMDTTKISDAQRMVYGVETLVQQREKVKRMNKLSDKN